MQQDDPMVVFTRTFDFLSWLLPMTNNFPRAQRKPPRGVRTGADTLP